MVHRTVDPFNTLNCKLLFLLATARREQEPPESRSSMSQLVAGASSITMAPNVCSSSDDGDSSGLTTDQRRRLDALANMYPKYSREVLHNILESTGFSLDTAIDLIQD